MNVFGLPQALILKKNFMTRLRDAEPMTKRSKLVLPAPQVSDTELEEVSWGELIETK